jgi:CDP-diacylglycerol--serine O-phosphatidyltransferase
MNLLLRQLPNFLTLSNLLMGMLAIIAMTNALVTTALLLMLGSLIADVFDGYLARKLGVADELGVQLDSLADVVTFGVLPALMLFFIGARYGDGSINQQTIAFFAAILAVSAGLRLGRFNIDTHPRSYFRGLATPAGGIMVAAWLWAQYTNQEHGMGISDFPWLGIALPLVIAVMYQLPLRLPGLKSPKAGKITLAVIVVLTAALFSLLGPIAICLGMLVYIAVGFINLLIKWY